MGAPAIIAENLSKKYRIGLREERHMNFPEAVMRALKAPFRRLRSYGQSARPQEDFWALKDVSFEVQPGEVLGIIGRNGAGKSTLLKILSRITEPTSGRAVIRGRVGSLLEVGTGFHPELSGRENIYLNGAILGMKKAEIASKFDEIVAFSEVEKFLDTPVKHYSSGMYVRLAFAVAAHLEPEILIVDEVLAVGDAAFQRKCLGKMQDVAGGGRTVLFVSHNMRAVWALCQRAILLENGSFATSGDAYTVTDTYLERFDAARKSPPSPRPDCAYTDIRIYVNDHPLRETEIWSTREAFRVCVEVKSRHPTPCPRFDIAFFAGTEVRLFGIQSDRFDRAVPDAAHRHWRLGISVDGRGISCGKLEMAVGLREERKGPYIWLWHPACELVVQPEHLPEGVAPASLVAPPSTLTVEGLDS